MKRMKWVKAGVVGAGVMMVLPQGVLAQGFLPHQDKARVANGQAIYSENCASCHGENLQGQSNWREPDSDGFMPAPPHDESGHTWHHPDRQLFLITKFGTERLVGGDYQSNMDGFGEDLSDQDILDVLGYIKSTWPSQVIKRHNQINDKSG